MPTVQDFSKSSPFNHREASWMQSAPTVGDLAVGQYTMNRREVTTSNSPSATQTIRLTYFTATKSETYNQIAITSGATAAAATPTLVRIGIYEEASNGDLTLIASTPNDTTLFAAITTAYAKALSAPVSISKGNRYAVGILVVTAVAAPSFYGNSSLIGSLAGAFPRISSQLTAQADLPASIPTASLSSSAVNIYSVLLP